MTSTPNSFVGVSASSPAQPVTGAHPQQISVNAITNSPGMAGAQMTAGSQQVLGMAQPGMGMVVGQAGGHGHGQTTAAAAAHMTAGVLPPGASGGGGAGASEVRVLDKRRLQELVKEVDPLEQLDEDVEEVLMQIADDFIENVVTASCKIAKHRKSSSLDVKDVQLHLERSWGMWIPGFGTDELRPYKKALTTEAHKQRMALIRKTLKKS